MALQNLKQDTNGNALVSAQLATLPQLAQGTAVAASPHGTMRITPDPTSIFYDAFSGNTLDTVDRWNTTGTAPVQTNGLLSLPAGTASTTSILTSKPVLPITASQHIFPAFAIKVEAAVGTGVGRFWGLGTAPTTPSPTSLAQEGVGFELDSVTGALQAVTYTGGVKTLILALTRPADGLMHRYSMQYRNSRTWWFVDDVNVYVATATFLNTAIQDLPLQVSSVSGATLTNAPSLILTAIGASDLNRQATQISDGIFPWRKATVSAAGAQKVDGSAVTQPVSGAFFQATQPVSIATNTPDMTDRAARAVGVVTVANLPTTTGRSDVVLHASAVPSVVAETVYTLNTYLGTTATTGTVYNVTTGKRYRLQAIRLRANFAVMSTTVTFASMVFRLRAQATAGATVASPLVLTFRLDVASNTPGPEVEIPIPDGLEWLGPNSLCITQSSASAAGALISDIALVGFEY